MKSHLFFSSLTIILFFFVLPVFSQHGDYMGTEKDLNESFLIEKAIQTDFSSVFVAEIFKDEKNTYYAVDNSIIQSKYIKIRILEQVFSDKKLVNIGSSIEKGYMLFLVNNTLIDQDEEIIELFNSYYLTAQKEEASMNEEEITQWMKNHNKYRKK